MKTQKFLTNFRENQLALYQEAISEGEDLGPFWDNFCAIQKKSNQKHA